MSNGAKTLPAVNHGKDKTKTIPKMMSVGKSQFFCNAGCAGLDTGADYLKNSSNPSICDTRYKRANCVVHLHSYDRSPTYLIHRTSRLARLATTPVTSHPPLRILSIITPARDEEGCIASTVEHLHLELNLRGVPQEIVVVDDGSKDRTWELLQGESRKIPELKPIKNEGPRGFGRAIERGLDAMRGDAAVIFMADESDDCRDVVRYWEHSTKATTAFSAAAS
jgi:hypothetical protein